MHYSNTSRRPRIYTVATAHLDTVWNWDFETTLSEYIPDTLHKNFKLFEKYPHYIFNFEGSYRYELMEEYYPEEFQTLKKYVADGRWYPNGGVFENGDVNVPSPEALFRNVLYGNEYFNDTFGIRTKDFYLPDCFGFGWALPSVAHHANLLGFTTQKLPWSSAFGIPFDLGKWQGVDGNEIYVSLNAGSYSRPFFSIRTNKFLIDKLKENTEEYDLPWTFGFHGVGDIGGAPAESSVKLVEESIMENDDSYVQVLSAPADQVFFDMETDLTNEQREKLPVWKTELVSRDHGAGAYTSRAIGKRWNRRGEQLADMAEKSSVFASWLGKTYPQDKIDGSWKRVIAKQFHDDLTGTSLQRVYKRSWNDYALSLNELTEEFRASSASVIQNMDTSFAKGSPIIVSNMLQYTRREAVEAECTLPEDGEFVAVFDHDGKEVPAQVTAQKDRKVRLVFFAEVQPLGYRVYDARIVKKASAIKTNLKVDRRLLENNKFIVKLNDNGDVASIFDKKLEKELLAYPIQMDLLDYNGSGAYPAWELTYDEMSVPAREHAILDSIRVKENGPARIMIETIKKAGESVFRQEISLTLDGESVEFYNEIEWRSGRTLLKTPFSLTASNSIATYDLGLGAIERGNSTRDLYEFPAQLWADVTDENGDFGVSIFSDSKYGWDKPNDNTIRLTGIHSPRGDYRRESMQSMLEFGLNRYGFAVYSHAGNYENDTQQYAEGFSQPLVALTTDKHGGALGANESFGKINNDAIAIRAIKKAQKGSEIIVRVNNTLNKPQKDIELTLGTGITSAREMYASEEEKMNVKTKIAKGAVVFNMKPFEVKTFSLVLKKASVKAVTPNYTPLELDYNIDVVSPNNLRGNGRLPSGESLPAELFPKTLDVGGVPFTFGSGENFENNALAAKGETIGLPKDTEQVYVIASSFHGDIQTSMIVGDEEKLFTVHDAQEAVGAWDLYGMGETGHIKQQPLAWTATHTHTDDGDHFGKNVYFFKYTFDVPKGAKSITLPQNEKIILLAVTAGASVPKAQKATRMYDHLSKRPFTYKRSAREKMYSASPKFWEVVDYIKLGNPANRASNQDEE